MVGKALGLVLGVFLLVGCAKPPADFEARVNALDSRSVNTRAIRDELKAQQDKFALFRSYMRVERLLEAAESGKTVEYPVVTPVVQGDTVTAYATRCVDDSYYVCYCTKEAISCVHR